MKMKYIFILLLFFFPNIFLNRYDFLYIDNNTKKIIELTINKVDDTNSLKINPYINDNIIENAKKIINERNVKLINSYAFSPSHYINSSKEYWEKRYADGGNSGVGSYNILAQYKASVINNFVNKNNIKTVIEWGSGDCNQLSLANYHNYIGYDVSQTAINYCKNKFHNDPTKTFIHLNDNLINYKKADLSLSLDVIFHLVEDNVFERYMYNLFNSSIKYVCIYSSNFNKAWAIHVRHRKFTDWIDNYMSKSWKLKELIPNKYPFDLGKTQITSFCDFYFYEKIQ